MRRDEVTLPAMRASLVTDLLHALGWADGDDSVAAAHLAVATAPDDTDAHARLGWCYLKAQRPELARASFQQSLACAAHSALARLGLAALAFLDRDPELTSAQLRAAASDPHDPLAERIENIARILAAEASPTDAAARDALPSPSPAATATTWDDASAAYAAGIHAGLNGDHAGARAALEAAVRLDPQHIDAHHQLALACWALGRPRDAERFYRAALALDPDHARALCGLGVVLAHKGEEEAALEALKRAVSLDPADAKARTHLGVLHRRRGDAQSAIDCYLAALAADPHSVEALYNLAVTLAENQRFQEAIPVYHRLLQSEPDHLRARSGLGVALYEAGDLPQAISALEEVITRDPDDAYAHYFLGLAEVASQAEGRALRQYRILQQLDPDLSLRLFASIYG